MYMLAILILLCMYTKQGSMTTSESTCGHNTLMSSGRKRAKQEQYKFYTEMTRAVLEQYSYHEKRK